MAKVHQLRVAAWNSTVNGRGARDRDARKWFDGWRNLGVHAERSWVDGKEGRNIFGCGEYLHAPVTGKGADHRSYRVRCRFEPCRRYRGATVKTVTLKRIGKFWHWILESA